MPNIPKVPSLVVPYGIGGSSCGYCSGKNDGTHTALNMSAKRLTCEDYQYLIDRTWRRSGKLCYKPVNEGGCCPCYTIRCDALQFKPSRSQKRVLKNVHSYLRTGVIPKKNRSSTDGWQSHTKLIDNRPLSSVQLSKKVDVPSQIAVSDSGDIANTAPISSSVVLTHPREKKTKREITILPAGDTRANQKQSTSRARRWEAKKKRLLERSVRENRPMEELMKEYMDRRTQRLKRNAPKDIEHFLSEHLETEDQVAHHLEVRLIRSCPPCSEFQDTLETTLKLFRKYQMTVHHEPEDDCTMERFTRFLVKSPLIAADLHDGDNTSGAPPFGSYHQQYWLDGKQLIAVGVVDLLPRCLSSVYLFYDPAYSFLQLGTYSALREIAFVRNLARTFGPNSNTPSPRFAQFDSYYMGYFIRSCPKMAYKARFRPSYLACPVTFNWVPVESCLQLLDAVGPSGTVRFSDLKAVDRYAITDRMADELDRHVICRVKFQQEPRKYSRGSIEDPDTLTYGSCITLEHLSPYLSPAGLDVLRKLVIVLGQYALSGHFQFVIP